MGSTVLLSSLEPLLPGDFPLPNMIIWTRLRASTFETLEAYFICELRGISSRDVEGGAASSLQAQNWGPEQGEAASHSPFHMWEVPPQRRSPCLRVTWLQTRRTLCAPAPPPPATAHADSSPNVPSEVLWALYGKLSRAERAFITTLTVIIVVLTPCDETQSLDDHDKF